MLSLDRLRNPTSLRWYHGLLILLTILSRVIGPYPELTPARLLGAVIGSVVFVYVLVFLYRAIRAGGRWLNGQLRSRL